MVLSPQDFDRLLEALRGALTKDPGTGFVFSCLSGQGRTTTAMVVAVLACWHIGVGGAFCLRSEVIPGMGGFLAIVSVEGQRSCLMSCWGPFSVSPGRPSAGFPGVCAGVGVGVGVGLGWGGGGV